MRDSGDAISVSLEEIAFQMRAIAGRLSEFPDAGVVGTTLGHSSGASYNFHEALGGAGAQLSSLTTAMTRQLALLETAISTTGNELVAADEAVASDVGALEAILATVAEPAPATTTTAATTTSATTPTSPTTTLATTAPATTAPTSTGSTAFEVG